jgi:hypothetical protein
VIGVPGLDRLRRGGDGGLGAGVLGLAALVEEGAQADGGEDADDEHDDEQLDEREAVSGAETGARHLPSSSACPGGGLSQWSAGWPSRAAAWASCAASKRPLPSHHGQGTRCGAPPRPEISSPEPRQAVQVLGSCSGKAGEG